MIAPAAHAAEGDFFKALTPEESKSAGLGKLAPEELARLEALVERYRSGQVTVAVAQKAAETRSAEPAKPKKLVPDWVGALITLQHTEAKPEGVESLESSLTGDFTGWSGRSTFRLENGQIGRAHV